MGTFTLLEAVRRHGQDREVGGHGEVLEDEDRENSRRLPVAQPLQVSEHSRDDARGRDVRRAREGHDPHGVETCQPTGQGPGCRVEDEVDDR